MIQILIILIFVSIALFLPKERVLVIALFILPFHALLKGIINLEAGDSNIFSIWKEIVILILFCRVILDILKNKISNNTRFPVLLILSYFLLTTCLFIISTNKTDALTSYKNFSFPLLCFFTVANLDFHKIDQSRFLKYISISALIVFIVAHLQQFFFKLEFATLMNLVDSVGSNGEIYYSQGATQIMGKDRMYGCFVGPNELGLYTCMILIIIISYLYTVRVSLKQKLFLLFVMALGLATLLQTYSRVSWFIFIGTTFFYFIREKQYKMLFYAGTTAFLFLLIIVSALPDASAIINSTAHLKEASAADRSSEFTTGFGKVVNTPMGYGLGTIEYSSTQHRVFHTEIYWWLVFGEMGILIGLQLFIIYFYSTVKIFLFDSTYNIFTRIVPVYLIFVMLSGFASIILFEPVVQVYLWSFIGIAYNKNIQLHKSIN